MKSLLIVKSQGLYCPEGDFYIDAWAPVHTCIVTHAHGDHARGGHKHYIAHDQSLDILRYRLGGECAIQTFPYGQKFKMENCWVSLHPAGHILGSAQVRIECNDRVCVISGDYKRSSDPTCEPFELLECDTFVTESTFALPIYMWEPAELTIQKIFDWWQENRSHGFCSVLFGYALGKSQRILALLSKLTEETVYAHGGILPLADLYKKQGIKMVPYRAISDKLEGMFSKELVLAPPLAQGTPWMKRFYPYKTAMASGWMQVRGTRRRRNIDRGFVLSDHADWADLLTTIKQTKASTVFTTHGNAHTLAKFLREQNINAYPLLGTEIMEEGEG